MKDQLRTGEIDSVNPQTRQSDRQADKTKRERRGEGGAFPKPPRRRLPPPYTVAIVWDVYTRASGHFTCGSAFKYICDAYILSFAARKEGKKNQRKVITIIPLLCVINRQAGASVEEGFKCLFTLK